MKKNNGGAAFPVASYQYTYYPEGSPIQMTAQTEPQNGMSLRDYFAGQALKGLLSNEQFYLDGNKAVTARNENPFEAASRASYGYADAMVVERDKI